MVFNKQQNQQAANSNQVLNQQVRSEVVQNDIKPLSTFDKSFTQSTTFNSGKLVPILVQEVSPNDVYEIETNGIIRLSSIATNPIDNPTYDIIYCFVPYNIIDPQFNEVMGETKDYGFSDSPNFPLLKFDSDFQYSENDLANYFNIPINTNLNGLEINLYPFMAYNKFVNDFVRDQNLQSCVDNSSFLDTRILESSKYSSDNQSYLTKLKYGKDLASVSKFSDYFTTNLPWQQKGKSINIGSIDLSNLKVSGYIMDSGNGSNKFTPRILNNSGNPIRNDDNKNALYTRYGHLGYFDIGDSSVDWYDGQDANLSLKLNTDTTSIINANGSTSEYNINDLRYSIVSQHYLERLALSGSRYIEQLKSFWGIEIDPILVDRCEIIGGSSGVLNFASIPQTSSTTSNSPQGSLASVLYNTIHAPKFTYSNKLHGLLLGFVVIRTPLNYGSQGLPKLFSKTNKFDLYNPIFEGIGEQPTYVKELKLFDNEDKALNDKTFGYNEAFIEYKSNYNQANGYLSLNSNNSMFSLFLFGQKFNNTLKLDSNFINYDPNIIGNMLFKVDNNTNEFFNQFIAVFHFNIKYSSQMKVFNNPKVWGI